MSHSIMGTTTIMLIILFGCNALLWLFFQFLSKIEGPGQARVADPKKDGKKELSKPFTTSIEGFTCLTHDFLKLGFIMALTYVCENHWFFPHSKKEYSRDLFMFIILLFFAYGFYTLKPTKDLTLLSRDQTEEWKGWMQFIFLLYHCESLCWLLYYFRWVISVTYTALSTGIVHCMYVMCCRFPCRRSVQLRAHHDHLLRVDDRIRQL